MTVKQGADISKIHPQITNALATIDHLWLAFFPEDRDGMVVTSGHEGKAGDGVHGDKSNHYIQNNESGFGEAVDIRLNDVLQHKATIFCGLVSTVLIFVYGDKFKVFAEGILKQSAHLHLELK